MSTIVWTTAPTIGRRGYPWCGAASRTRRGLVGWAIGIGLYVGMITAFWSSIGANSAISEAFNDYPDAMKELFGGIENFDFSKPGNYLNVELFSLMTPLLLGVFAIGFAASTLAGEEQGGQLDVLLAAPVSRRRVVAEKAFTLVVAVAGLTVFTWLSIVVVGAMSGLDLGLLDLAAACAGSGLVALVYGSIAFTVGAATGRRAAAISASAALFAAGYLFQVLSGLVDGLRPLRMLSALYVANGTTPVNNGFPVARDIVLVAVVTMCLGAAGRVFDRRDLSV